MGGDQKDHANTIRFLSANATFHNMIITESQNPLLSRLAGRHNYLGSVHRQATASTGQLWAAIVEHQELIDALAQHDSEKAEHLARQHVKTLRANLASNLNK